ncbi:MAG TPA: hypothetical protein VGF69_22985 [Thermoanaerobaculia bacterium]|jgi:hypothetical protein
MTDDPAAWMIPGGAFLAVVVYFVLRARGERKREGHFAALAAHRGAVVESFGVNAKRFFVAVDDRRVDVRDAYRGGGIGGTSSGSHYLTIATPLRGRSWDLHSVKIGKRFLSKSGEPFERRFKVEDLGLPMPEQWLTADVRAGVEAVFAVGVAAAVIEIDAGELVHRAMASPVEVDAETLDSLVERQVALARAIERARPR